MVAAVPRLQHHLDLPCRGCLIDGLPARQRSALCSTLLRHAYEPEQPIYYEGTPALAVFNILRGSVKLWRMGQAGDQYVIAMRGAGCLIGYRAVIAGRPYTVTAEPLERTVVCTIPRETFLPLLHESPELSYRLLEMMARNSFETEELLSSRGLDSVIKRTARTLLRLGCASKAAPDPRGGTHLPTKREDLARFIGTTPETLSRTLHVLASRGILDLSEKKIRILDVDALERLAE